MFSVVPSYLMLEETENPVCLMNSVAALVKKLLLTSAFSDCSILPPHIVAGAFNEIKYVVPLALEGSPPLSDTIDTQILQWKQSSSPSTRWSRLDRIAR